MVGWRFFCLESDVVEKSHKRFPLLLGFDRKKEMVELFVVRGRASKKSGTCETKALSSMGTDLETLA